MDIERNSFYSYGKLLIILVGVLRFSEWNVDTHLKSIGVGQCNV